MKEELEKHYIFNEDRVTDWCDKCGDANPMHVDESAAEDSIFGKRTVPNMMILDRVSGMLSQMAEDDEDVILSNLAGIRFRDPIFFNEAVTINLDLHEKDKRTASFDLEVRVPERESLVVTGALTVVVKEGDN